MLTLSEKLFVLAIHSEKGTILASVEPCLGYALGGAAIAELALQGKVHIGEGHRLKVTDPEPTGDDILDDALALFQKSDTQRKITYWVKTLNEKPKKTRERLVERLQAKGVIHEEETHLAWIIPSQEYPDWNVSAKYVLKTRLREMLIVCGEADLEHLALLSLAQACSLFDFIFFKDERRIVKNRLYELLVKQAFNNQVAETIQEIENAVGSLTEED